jgi:hypothetical protein
MYLRIRTKYVDDNRNTINHKQKHQQQQNESRASYLKEKKRKNKVKQSTTSVEPMAKNFPSTLHEIFRV